MYKIKFLNYIKNSIKYIKIFFLIIRLFNIEEIINNFINEIFFTYNQENNIDIKSKDEENIEKEEYQKEIDRNVLIIKFIITSSLICWFNLSQEQGGYLFMAVMLTEIVDNIFRKD